MDDKRTDEIGIYFGFMSTADIQAELQKSDLVPGRPDEDL